VIVECGADSVVAGCYRRREMTFHL